MTKTRRPVHVFFVRHLRNWHRQLGIISSVFILGLSVSGLLLNHSDEFAFNQRYVTNALLLNFYGIKNPNRITYFASGGLPDDQHNNRQIVQTDDVVWLAEQKILELSPPVIGTAQLPQMLIVATESSLYLLSADGQLIDRLDANSGLPAPIINISADQQQLWIQTGHGVFVGDDNLLSWQQVYPLIAPNWSTPLASTPALITRYNELSRGQMLHWERVIMDVHSGRIWGRFGPYFSDLVALLLIILSCTGIYMWVRQARSKR